MALSAAAHHSYDQVAVGEKNYAPRGQKTDRACREVEERELYDSPRCQKPPPPGTQPASLAEPREDVVNVQRHTVNQTVDAVSPMLDVLVPLREEQLLVAMLTHFDLLVAEQVIEVPKISSPSRVSRAVLSEPQTAEQLLEVPTIVSCSSLQQTAEQTRQSRQQILLPQV